jgi:hypothetical protein
MDKIVLPMAVILFIVSEDLTMGYGMEGRGSIPGSGEEFFSSA